MRLLLLATSLMASSAFGATLNFVDLFRIEILQQTSNVAPAGGQYFFAARIFKSSAGDFDGGSLTPPGLGALAMTNNGTDLEYASGLFSNLANLNAVSPTGIYTFTATDSTLTNADQTVGVNFTGDSFATSTPYLTNFSSLSGLDTSAGFTFNWNAFTGAVSDSFVFFTITNHATSATVVNDGFLAPTTTSAFIAGGTLAAGTQYDYTLIFSNRVTSTYSSGSASFNPVIGSDLSTSGTFTTGGSPAPEPASILFAASGLIALIGLRRKLV